MLGFGTTTYDPATDHAAIARLAAKGRSSATILSGLGHPGYGEKYAARVIEAMLFTGRSAHKVIYG